MKTGKQGIRTRHTIIAMSVYYACIQIGKEYQERMTLVGRQ